MEESHFVARVAIAFTDSHGGILVFWEFRIEVGRRKSQECDVAGETADAGTLVGFAG